MNQISASNSPLAGTLVFDAMRHGVLTCQGETSLRTIARMMSEHRVHSIVVTDLDGVTELPWGIVSDSDLLQAAGTDPDAEAAARLARTELLTVTAGETLERAAQLMAEHEVTHVVVVGDGGRPLGVLSSLDVARVMAG
jgi:CBS domain-containing protein